MEKYKLCYIEGNFAWFTTASLDEQWGDDWDDAPYEHNAGEPYEMEEYDLIKVAFDGWFYFPVGSYVNSPFSVQYINNKAVPWIECVYGDEKLWAGATIKEFVKYIENNEGEVFYPIRKITEKSINFYETN